MDFSRLDSDEYRHVRWRADAGACDLSLMHKIMVSVCLSVIFHIPDTTMILNADYATKHQTERQQEATFFIIIFKSHHYYSVKDVIN